MADQGILFDYFPAIPGSVGGCPCCFPSFAVAIFVTLALGLQLVTTIVSSGFPKNAFIGKVVRWSRNLAYLGLSLLAVGYGVLLQSPKLRESLFFQFAVKVFLADQPLHAYRCDQFRGIHGRVLEIGPGPGTNFRCWSKNKDITEWVGVEPNPLFAEALRNESVARNIPFPVRTVWLRGESMDVDVEPESFDYVVGAHVLCSVDHAETVLKQVQRALKPGGQYLFLEHVAASADHLGDKFSWLDHAGQIFFQPFINTIGNGCQFKRLWETLRTDQGLRECSYVQLEHKYIPMSLSIFSPHIVGKAVKKFTKLRL